MLSHLRRVMYEDTPGQFRDTVEMDETYVGGQWRNKPARIRRLGTKRGHGTSKQAIFGIYHRKSKTVFVCFVPDLKSRTLLPIIHKQVQLGSVVYTDGYNVYKPLERWYARSTVDHASGEYVRGDVHTNSIESFWGYLKRRLKITGGVRMSRLHLYVAEETWRFNYRTLSLDEKTEKLYQLLVANE
jgi:transposase-like protein